MINSVGYQFEVIYKPGPDNKVADSLSRIFEEGEHKILVSSPVWEQQKRNSEGGVGGSYVEDSPRRHDKRPTIEARALHTSESLVVQKPSGYFLLL